MDLHFDIRAQALLGENITILNDIGVCCIPVERSLIAWRVYDCCAGCKGILPAKAASRSDDIDRAVVRNFGQHLFQQIFVTEEIDLLHLQRVGGISFQRNTVAKEYGIDFLRQRVCQRIQILLDAEVGVQLTCDWEIQDAVPSVAAADRINVCPEFLQQPCRSQSHAGVCSGNDDRFPLISEQVFQIHIVFLSCSIQKGACGQAPFWLR